MTENCDIDITQIIDNCQTYKDAIEKIKYLKIFTHSKGDKGFDMITKFEIKFGNTILQSTKQSNIKNYIGYTCMCIQYDLHISKSIEGQSLNN